MSASFSKLNALFLLSIIAALIFGVICVDKHLNATSTHSETVFASCMGQSDTKACSTTHQFLGNLTIVSAVFIFALLIALGTRDLLRLITRSFSGNNSIYLLHFNITFPQAVPVCSSYLVQAFSSGILNPRLYN